MSIQIFEASQVLSKMLSKILELANIKELKADIINFRNMAAINLRIITDSVQETANIIMPRIRQENSPALNY